MRCFKFLSRLREAPVLGVSWNRWLSVVCACGWIANFLALGGVSLRPPLSPINLSADSRIWNYHFVDAFSGVSLTRPVFAVAPPGETNRILVGQHDGRIYEISPLDAPVARLFLDLSDRVHEESEGGLHGLAFHPQFRENGVLFVTYMTASTWFQQTNRFDRLSRFTAPALMRVPGAVMNPQAIRDSEVVMIHQADRHPDHNAGDLHFGPDGYLYVSLGDEGGQYDEFENAQRIDLNFFSGILRLDVDQRPGNLAPNPHPAVTPGTYRVPSDNPWVGAATFRDGVLDPLSVRTEFYAVGMRNPWRFGFDPLTGDLYCNDTGDHTREEVNRVVKGGNYGYPIWEGTVRGPRPLAGPDGPDLLRPLVEYGREQGGAVTAGLLYRGPKYPLLQGSWIVSDFWQGFVGAVRFKPDGSALPVDWFAWASGISSLTQDPATGDILATDFFNNRILRLVEGPEPTSEEIPQTLSKLGAFSDVASQTPNLGVVPYEVNVPFWSDGAEKQRWFALPNAGTSMYQANEGPSAWWYPEGTVFIKTLGLEQVQGDPSTRRRLETRVLVVNSGHVAEGFTYRWNDSQTDAVLLPPSGTNQTFVVQGPDGAIPVNWRFPSRRECFSCHHTSSGGIQGFSLAQLNRDVVIDGKSVHQFDALVAAGYLNSIPQPRVRIPTLATATNTDWSLEWRTRSFLAVNCSPCHRDNGIAVLNWFADLGTPLDATGIIGGIPYNNLGDYQSRIIAPGAPEHSVLFQRLSKLGQGHMPPLANSVVNLQGVDLVRQWIVRDTGSYQSYEDWALMTLGGNSADGYPFRREDDPDGDGYPNEYEWLAGTSGLEPSPQLGLQLEVTPDGALLNYLRRANRDYSIQTTATPGDPASWSDVNDPQNSFFLADVDSQASVLLPVGQSVQFFRLALNPR